jgi:hypothetical protein
VSLKFTDAIAASQSSKRTDHEFPHVEAGDVLDHHAARLHQFAVQRGEFHPDDQIAGGTVKSPAGAADVRGHDAAHCRRIAVGAVEGNHLSVAGEKRVELGEGHTGFDADGVIARLILKQPPHTYCADANIGGRDRPRHQVL